MKKINFTLLDEPLEINQATFLVVEQREAYSDLIRQFYQFNEESSLKLFDASYKTLKESEILLVTDVLGYDVNSPAILKLIYKDLEDQLNEKPEIKTHIEQLTNEISDIISYEILNHEIDLEKDEITILELFKALGIKVETRSDTLFEKMIEIIQVYKYLSKKKLLVFINVCTYFSDDELLEISSYISLSQIDVLFLDKEKRDVIKQYILDEDFYLQ